MSQNTIQITHSQRLTHAWLHSHDYPDFPINNRFSLLEIIKVFLRIVMGPSLKVWSLCLVNSTFMEYGLKITHSPSNMFNSTPLLNWTCLTIYPIILYFFHKHYFTSFCLFSSLCLFSLLSHFFYFL